MIELTTSYQLIKQEYVGNAYGDVYLKCYAKYDEQDVPNNRTKISVATNLYTAGTWWGQNGQRWYAGATGLTTAEGQAPDNYGAGQEVTLGVLSGWISHENDGTKAITVSSGFISTPWGFNKTIGDGVKLPTIQRASYPIDYVMTVSNDGNTITLKPTFTKYVSSFYQTLDVQLKTSSTTWQTLFTLSGVNSGTTYTLNGTQKQAIYNAIGTNTSQTFRYLLNTYISSGGQLVGNYGSNRTTTLPNYTISLNVSMADSVTAYNPYKPSGHENDTFIANLSKPTFGLTGASSTGSYYGRSLSYKLGNTTINTPYTENNYTGQSFSFVATDGRKSSSTITPTFTNIAYFKPTLTTKVVRPTPTGSTATVTVNGTYYDGTGLTNLETPEVQFAYIEEGGTQQIVVIPLTTSTSGIVTSFNGTATLTGLNYKKTISWTTTLTDKLNISTNNNGVVPEGQPLWNGYKRNDENYFNINGNLMINDATFLNLVYPVGSIYMSVNNTNPSTLFGGSWEQLNDRFLLGAGSTYTAGTTGGTATHQHKLPIMRHNAGGTVTNQFGLITSGNDTSGQVTTSSTGPTSIQTLRTSGDLSNATYEYQFSSMSASNIPPYLVVYMWKRTA